MLEALRRSDVVLVVMGPDWAGSSTDGSRRIDDPHDLEFEGNESVDNGASEFPLTGSWAHSRLAFTVDRNGQTATCTANLTRDALDELTLQGPGGPYLIRRQQ